MTPVKETALRLGLPVFQPVRVREEDFVEQMRELAPDVIVVSAFRADYSRGASGASQNMDASISTPPFCPDTGERRPSSGR